MTKLNAEHADQADVLMKQAGEVVDHANGSMKELTNSMEDITKTSEETSKIIKTIDEIAFQTNLLALNAAVEAARSALMLPPFNVFMPPGKGSSSLRFSSCESDGKVTKKSPCSDSRTWS